MIDDDTTAAIFYLTPNPSPKGEGSRMKNPPACGEPVDR